MRAWPASLPLPTYALAHNLICWCRLFNGVDHLGRTCGTKGTDDSGFHFDFTNKDKIYYPELQKNLIFAFEQYPELYDPRFGGTSGNAPLYGICMAECPRVGDFVTPHDSNEKKSWKTFYNTSSVLNRCIADDVTCREPNKA